MTVFRNMAHTGKGTLADTALCNVLTTELYRTGRYFIKAGKCRYKFCLSVSIDTGNTNNFTGTHIKGDIINNVLFAFFCSYGYMIYGKNYLSRLLFFFFYYKVDISAYHHTGQFFLCSIFNIYRTDILTFSQYTTTVCHRHNFI